MRDDDHPFADLLALETVRRDCFAGPSPNWVTAGDRRFGGATLAQMLRAATLTVGPDRLPHAMQAFFIAMGEAGSDLDLAVDRVHDGGSFSVRQVVAAQSGRTRAVATVSFTRQHDGAEWSAPIRADAPVPDGFPTPDLDPSGPGQPVPLHRMLHIARPFDVIEVDTDTLAPAGPYRTTRLVWVRAREVLADSATQACALAYVSDFGATIAARAVVGATIATPGRFASLNHALWLHRDPRLDRWNLLDFRPVAAAHSRGLVTASVHADDGEQVATFTQEAMMRVAGRAEPTEPRQPVSRGATR